MRQTIVYGEPRKRIPPKELTAKLIVHFLLIIGLISTLLPLFWMVSTSLKTQEAIFEIPPRLIPKHVSIENYINLFQQEIDFAYSVFSRLCFCETTLSWPGPIVFSFFSNHDGPITGELDPKLSLHENSGVAQYLSRFNHSSFGQCL